MRNKIKRVAVVATALAMASTLGAASAGADVVRPGAGHIKGGVYKTYEKCEDEGYKYSGDHEYWDCEWDSPYWALWVLK
jgi:squalene cyclase